MNSPTLLQYYGLPTLAQVGNLAEWQKIVTHDQTRQCDYTTPYRDGKPITHGRPTTAKATTSNSLTPQPLTNGSTPNSIWGGFGAMWCNGCWAFQGMQGEYPVSSIDICYTKCDVSIWAGVGGAINNETLVQAGVSQDSTTGTITGYYGFYEYALGGKEQDWWNVSSMDSMWSAAYQNGAVYDSDFTQNKYASTNVGVSSSNDSAEFIVERNGMSNCNNWPFYCVALANYHDYSISNVKYQLANTNWYNPDSSMENFWVWNLKNSSGQMLESNIGYYDYSGGASWVENWLQGS